MGARACGLWRAACSCGEGSSRRGAARDVRAAVALDAIPPPPSSVHADRSTPTTASASARRSTSPRRPTAALVSGAPAPIAMPPSHAPVALPRLNAPWFKVEARFGAWLARSTISICSGGTIAKARMPHTKIVIIAGICACIVPAKMVRITTIASRNATSEGISRQSASLPPSVLPTVRPRPNSSSTSVTACGVKPVTSSRIGVMYVKVEKRLADASTLMPSTISTCGFFSTLNSRTRLAFCISIFAGRHTASAAAAAMPMPVTAQKVARQPTAWPSAVPSGTPSTLASVRPVNISAMACARRFGATSPGGHHRADTEERAVAERRDDARGHQHRVARRDRAQQIADDEHADQAHQRLLARHVGDRDRDDRRADRDAERIGRHQHAGSRDRYGEIARDIGQQPHDHELGGTDSKRGNGKGKQGQRHGDGA